MFINNKSKIRGFTLIELLVVIAIIGLLSSVVLASLNTARMKARDARRLSDMHQIQIALDLYYDSFGQYPDPRSDIDCGGWESSGKPVGAPSFITPLVSNKFLPTTILDPTINNGCGNYEYYRYGAGAGGCSTSRGAFYVLGVVNMETNGWPYPSSPGWSCLPLNNWQNYFDWVTGKFEN